MISSVKLDVVVSAIWRLSNTGTAEAIVNCRVGGEAGVTICVSVAAADGVLLPVGPGLELGAEPHEHGVARLDDHLRLGGGRQESRRQERCNDQSSNRMSPHSVPLSFLSVRLDRRDS